MSAVLNITGTIRQISELETVGKTHRINITIPEEQYFNGNKTTEWHRITLWGAMAERAAQYLSNGSVVQVDCRISYNNHNGSYYTNFTATSIEYLANYGLKNQEQVA